jgi:hypothetical protein
MGVNVQSGSTLAVSTIDSASIAALAAAIGAIQPLVYTSVGKSGVGTNTITVPANHKYRIFSMSLILTSYSSSTGTDYATMDIDGCITGSVACRDIATNTSTAATGTNITFGGYIELAAGKVITLTNSGAAMVSTMAIFYQDITL